MATVCEILVKGGADISKLRSQMQAASAAIRQQMSPVTQAFQAALPAS